MTDNSSRITFEELKTQTNELRYLNGLKTKSIVMDCYSFKKGILVKKANKMD